ncbi:MAG TPA: hypothetical protein VGS41_08430, partial [Chthonomonadales bacterium]|nr:hypothetical protein [Chthonomonadales bacterium]
MRLRELRIAVGVVLLVGAGTVGRAAAESQSAPRRIAVASAPVAALDWELKLTADQKSKIEAIHRKYLDDYRALRPAPPARPDEATRAKMAELTRRADDDTEATLTAEQKSQLPAALKEISDIRMIRIPLAIVGDLKLTEDQKSSIAGLAQEMRQKIEAMPRADRRAGIRALRSAMAPRVDALLTSEQKSA